MPAPGILKIDDKKAYKRGRYGCERQAILKHTQKQKG